MYRNVPTFAMLRAFEVYGRLGGIRRTAEHLAVDHAAISRQLRSLEEMVGTALIDRGAGERRLTAEGSIYHARISQAMREISDATAALRSRESPRLLLWSAPGFALRWLAPNLALFRAGFPNVDLELRPSDRPPSFDTNEADADIRFYRDGAPGFAANLKAVEIARPRVFPVASPDYVRSAGVKVGIAEELKRFELLHEENDDDWRDWFAIQDGQRHAKLDGPRLWHAHITLEAAIRGQGIAISNSFVIGDEIERGGLVEIRPSSGGFNAARTGSYYLVCRADHWSSRAMARFRNWLTKSCEAPAAH